MYIYRHMYVTMAMELVNSHGDFHGNRHIKTMEVVYIRQQQQTIFGMPYCVLGALHPPLPYGLPIGTAVHSRWWPQALSQARENVERIKSFKSIVASIAKGAG